MYYLFIYLIGFLSGTLALMVFVIRMRKQLYFDKLTGFKNAIYLDKIFYRYLQQGNCFILIDIDNFKQLNTQFGYETTDEILRQFTLALTQFTDEGTEIFRYKFGDEFLFIMNNKKETDAITFLELLKQNLEQKKPEVNGNEHPVFFSGGITRFLHNDNQSTITARLISALNKAKIHRNKLEII